MQFISCFILVNFVSIIAGYPSGPPKFSCLNGQPWHVNPQTKRLYTASTKSGMYTLMANATTWTPGDVIEVTLTAAAGQKFGGFALRAVRASTMFTNNSLGPLLGSFTCTNSQNVAMKLMSVYTPDNNINCVGHSREGAYTNLSCQWQSPASNEGPIVFQATAVQEYEVYQYLTTSAIASTAGNPTGQLASNMTSMPTLSGCGKTKTCATYPPMCDTRGGCTHAVMMTVQSDGNLLFEMFGSTTDWLGLGIADNTEMTNTELFICSYDSKTGQIAFRTAYSIEENVLAVYQPSISSFKTFGEFNQTSMVIPPQPNRLACQFVRPAVTNFTLYTLTDINQTIVSDLNAGSFVVLAQGSNLGSGTFTNQHVFMPLKSSAKFTTKTVQIMYFGGISRTVQTHATLMTIFWLFLAGFAIVIARHSRPVFTQQVVMDKNLWFILHICFMVVGFVIAIAGVTYLLVKEGEWSTDSQTHGIFGLIGMGLGVINIIAGLFRPHPGAKYRWIFNRLHRYNGLLSLLFAGIAIWLGATFSEQRPEFRLWAVIVLGIWTALQLLFMIGFEVARKMKAKDEIVSETVAQKYQMKSVDYDNMQVEQQQQQQQPEESKPGPKKVKGKQLVHVKSIWFIVYGLVFFAIAAAFWAGLWLH